ncbi:MAG: peroxiredoxin family protein [Methylosarcina sp.]
MKYLFFTIMIGLIGVGTWQLLDSASKPAPPVVFTTITGKKIALDELRGKPVIVTFWATDCPACVKEIPHWVELHRQFHGKGLEIIAVSMYYDPPSHVVSMANAERLPYDVALDFTGEHARAFGKVELTPTTFVIDRDGIIVEHVVGAVDPAKINTLVKKLLKG